MVEGNMPAQGWTSFNLGQLKQPVAAAHEAKKYLFIWDKNGSVATFMNYTASLCDLSPEIMKAQLGRQDNAAVAEVIRRSWILGQRGGKLTVLNVDKSTCDFNDFVTDGVFSTEFFNFEWMAQSANHEPYVKAGEDTGANG